MKQTQPLGLFLPIQIIHFVEWLSVYIIFCIWWGTTSTLIQGCFFLLFAYGTSTYLRYFLAKIPPMIMFHALDALLLTLYEKIYIPFIPINYHVGIMPFTFAMLILFVSLYLGIEDWRNHFEIKPYERKNVFFVGPILLYIYSATIGLASYETVATILTVIIILLQLWAEYQQGIWTYLKQNRDFDNLPKDQIVQHNNSIAKIIITGFGLLLLISCFIQSHELLLWVGEKIVQFLLLIAIGLFKILEFLLNFIFGRINKNFLSSVSQLYNSLLSMNAAHRLWNILYYLFSTLLIGYLLFRWLKSASSYFKQKEETKTTTSISYENALTPDKIEQLNTKSKKRQPHPRNERERIRFNYKKRIEKEFRHHVPKTKTAQELTQTVLQRKQDASLSSLTKKYEQARYSEEND